MSRVLTTGDLDAPLTRDDVVALLEARLRSPWYRSQMLDAQRTLFKPRVVTTQAELSKLSETATDGDECYALADAANGVMWRLRFRAASTSAYRWEFVGGAALRQGVETAESVAASGAYQNLTTAGPQVTLPLAGTYDIAFEAEFQNTTTGANHYLSYDLGSTGATDAVGIGSNPWAANVPFPIGRRRQISAAAGDLLNLRYKAGGGTHQWGKRSVWAIPMRLG